MGVVMVISLDCVVCGPGPLCCIVASILGNTIAKSNDKLNFPLLLSKTGIKLWQCVSLVPESSFIFTFYSCVALASKKIT